MTTEEYYSEHVAPVIARLHADCVKQGIPMVAVFEVRGATRYRVTVEASRAGCSAALWSLAKAAARLVSP